nr:immunoglobulin heavy chain junction region [Macaca mulatta]
CAGGVGYSLSDYW